jgi:hypothetical protein
VILQAGLWRRSEDSTIPRDFAHVVDYGGWLRNRFADLAHGFKVRGKVDDTLLVIACPARSPGSEDLDEPGLGGGGNVVTVTGFSLQQNPRVYAVVHGNIRRAALARFPYSLFFREEEEAIYIVACLHGRRDPRIWTSRI